MLKFTRLISDGAVLQRNKKIHIWGWGDAGKTVNVTIKNDMRSEGISADITSNGRFDAYFEAGCAGGPYTITAVSGDESISVSDVYIGDVLVMSGQSNMEFPMSRVRDTYPSEWENPGDNLIRTFKVAENGVFDAPLEDAESGEWHAFNEKTIDDYSAVSYFCAKRLRQEENIAVGLIDISLGGAPIEAFLSSEMLAGFEGALNEANKFKDASYRESVLKKNEADANGWRQRLDSLDKGLWEGWESGRKIINTGNDFMLPGYFSDTELSGFIGSIWFARKFDVPKEYAKRSAWLWLGTITDYDFCYINGALIGSTPYCYPPRRYNIPEGLIKEGENTIVLRVCVEKGFGRFTPGKLYGVIFGAGRRITDGFNETIEGAEHVINLSGGWKYLKGCGNDKTEEPEKKIDRSADTVFINWKPTALFNGMLNPVTNFPVKAFCFYQGESNCGNADEYPLLVKRQAEGYRKLWGDDKLPYICVQLPNFDSRIEEATCDGGISWRSMQKAQEKCLEIHDAYLIRTYGYGEDNDLHPQQKEPVGQMIAEVVMNL